MGSASLTAVSKTPANANPPHIAHPIYQCRSLIRSKQTAHPASKTPQIKKAAHTLEDSRMDRTPAAIDKAQGMAGYLTSVHHD
jgi:hypothetical protein